MSGASHSNVARRFYKFCEPRELDFLRFLESGPQRPTVGDEGRLGERGLVFEQPLVIERYGLVG